eukprot:TRINITY_DN91166_c0_g1_i1.p1 TRINITY_DN91166_c0_g1~~TRINITY_DN91166_c0_g1_i1.p1  ORF type:complete len:1405 (+),score=458.94 TRINITY_DN91166_c0_g1_i1:75-4289(+)
MGKEGILEVKGSDDNNQDWESLKVKLSSTSLTIGKSVKIPLVDISNLRRSAKKKNDLTFIVDGDREVRLRADSPDVAQDWMDAIAAAQAGESPKAGSDLDMVGKRSSRKKKVKELDHQVKEDIRSKLKAACFHDKKADMQRMFESIDKDRSGTLSLDEFLAALRKVFKINKDKVTDEDAVEFYNWLDVSDDGVIEIEELKAFVGDDRGRAGRLSNMDRQATEKMVNALEAKRIAKEKEKEQNMDFREQRSLIKREGNDSFTNEQQEKVRIRLRAAAIGQGRGEDLVKNLRAMVRKVDKDDTGELNAKELQVLVRKYMKIAVTDMSDSQVASLYLHLDADGTGQVDVQELVHFIGEDRGRMTLMKEIAGESIKETCPAPHAVFAKKQLGDIIDKLRGKIKTLTKGGKPDLVEKFCQDVDTDGSGELDHREMKSLVRQHLGFDKDTITDKQINLLFEVLDSDSGGSISFDELSQFIVEKQNKGSGKKVNMGRLEQLYQQFTKKQEKLKQLKLVQEEAELKKIQDSKAKSKIAGHWTTRQSVMDSLDPGAAAERLYNAFFESEQKMSDLKAKYAEIKKKELEERMTNNRPTRSRSQPVLGGAAEAGRRLYDDAERRERDRQQAQDAAAMAEMEELQSHKMTRPRPGFDSRRHADLFNEAAQRVQRKKQKADEALEAEKADLQSRSVPCGGEGRQLNYDRIKELHQEHADRSRKMAKLVSEKQMAEAQEIANLRKLAVGTPRKDQQGRAVRPSIVDDPRSPRSVFSSNRAEREAAEQEAKKKKEGELAAAQKRKGPKSLTTQADHALAAIISTIISRCSYARDSESLWDSDHRPLAPPLKAVMNVYREALKNCEASEGFVALCGRASQRLFRERLLPEFEGWARGIEPDPVRQVEDSLEDLLATAGRAQEVLKEAIAGPGPWGRNNIQSHPRGVPIALFAYDPGVKSKVAAEAKAVVRYGPAEGQNRYRHLTDIARVLLVFSSCDMLQAGLDQILRRYEVVDVKNYFNTTGRMGLRFVEVLVIMQVGEDEDRIPHVCEIRLEEICFHKAQELAAPYYQQFVHAFDQIYARAGRDMEALRHLVHTVMVKPPPTHDLRVFRCHLSKRFGSTICAWRKQLGGGRLMSFLRFREMCQKMNCGEHATEFWQGLDPGLGGCISMFDMDPEASALLVKLRTRMLALADVGHDKDVDAESLFARLCFLVRPHKPGHLEKQEFRMVAMPLGLSKDEADKVFTYLDHHAGISHPATITVADIAWLIKLPNYVDTQAVTMTDKDAVTENEALRNLTWQRASKSKRGEVLKWSVYDDGGITPRSQGSESLGGGLRQSRSDAKSEDGLGGDSGGGYFSEEETTGTRSASQTPRQPTGGYSTGGYPSGTSDMGVAGSMASQSMEDTRMLDDYGASEEEDDTF